MFGFLKKKKSEEELYLEDLERRKQAQGSCSSSSSAAFELKVEDVFSISGRGTVVTGRVAQGKIALGDRILTRGREGRTLDIWDYVLRWDGRNGFPSRIGTARPHTSRRNEG